MKKMRAVVFGSTGLTGSFLLYKLLEDSDFEKVLAVTRHKIDYAHAKLKVRRINFLNPNDIDDCVKYGTVVFSSIGTTKSKVKGNKNEYRKIDFDITYNIGQACMRHRIAKYIVISSAGANSSSANFYLKLKGQIEKELFSLNLKSLIILRPSLLLGKRKEFRLGERIAQIIIPIFSQILPLKIKPVKAQFVANAMVYYSKINLSGNHIVSNRDILELVK